MSEQKKNNIMRIFLRFLKYFFFPFVDKQTLQILSEKKISPPPPPPLPDEKMFSTSFGTDDENIVSILLFISFGKLHYYRSLDRYRYIILYVYTYMCVCVFVCVCIYNYFYSDHEKIFKLFLTSEY